MSEPPEEPEHAVPGLPIVFPSIVAATVPAVLSCSSQMALYAAPWMLLSSTVAVMLSAPFEKIDAPPPTREPGLLRALLLNVSVLDPLLPLAVWNRN